MSGKTRTFFVILFCWAALTVITPILVRLSASAKLLDYRGELKNGVIQSNKGIMLLARKALGSVALPPRESQLSSSISSSPSPSSSSSPSLSQPRRKTTFELEVSEDTEITSILISKNTIT